jgi:hypothetical protein
MDFAIFIFMMFADFYGTARSPSKGEKEKRPAKNTKQRERKTKRKCRRALGPGYSTQSQQKSFDLH